MLVCRDVSYKDAGSIHVLIIINRLFLWLSGMVATCAKECAINKRVSITTEAVSLVAHWGYWIDQFSPSMVRLFSLDGAPLVSSCRQRRLGNYDLRDLHDPSSLAGRVLLCTKGKRKPGKYAVDTRYILLCSPFRHPFSKFPADTIIGDPAVGICLPVSAVFFRASNHFGN